MRFWNWINFGTTKCTWKYLGLNCRWVCSDSDHWNYRGRKNDFLLTRKLLKLHFEWRRTYSRWSRILWACSFNSILLPRQIMRVFRKVFLGKFYLNINFNVFCWTFIFFLSCFKSIWHGCVGWMCVCSCRYEMETHKLIVWMPRCYTTSENRKIFAINLRQKPFSFIFSRRF